MFGNKAGEDAFFTDGHLVAEDRLLLLSDGLGDITAVDLRTTTQVRAIKASPRAYPKLVVSDMIPSGRPYTIKRTRRTFDTCALVRERS